MTMSKYDLVKELMEHVLVTPEFSGTDDEKIAVLQYWAELIKTVRGINLTVSDHSNKIKILDQIAKELEQLRLEITNATAQPTQSADGMPIMKKLPDEDQPTVDLSVEPPDNYPPSSPFSPHRPLTTEDLQRISGGISTADMCKLAGVSTTSTGGKITVKETDVKFHKKTVDAAGLQKMAGIIKTDASK